MERNRWDYKKRVKGEKGKKDCEGKEWKGKI